MARHDPQVSFRIPADLKDKLDKAAAENNRTITAELVLRLEKSFANDARRQAFNEINPNTMPDELVDNALEVIEMLRDVIGKRDK